MKKLLLSAASVAMLVACADNVINSYDDAKSKARITLSVLDNKSNTPIAGASVRNQFDDKPSTTDSAGYVYYKSQDIGSYIFEVSAEGYATIRTQVSVVETGANDVSRVPDVAKTVQMYKTGVDVEGYVYYRDVETGNLIPAEDVTVVLSYVDADVFPSELTTTTDEDGAYVFEDLAETVGYSVDAMQTTIKSKVYRSVSSVSTSGLRSGAKENLDQIVMSVEGKAPTLLSTNLNDVDTSSTLKLTFSTELADSLLGNWSVTKGSSNVLVTTDLSKDAKTITIKPVSGTWGNNAAYTISGRAYSKSGVSTTVNKSFTVGSVALPKQVSDLKVATDSTDYDEDDSDTYNYNYNIRLMLSWKAPSGEVDGYHIYYKTDDMSDFVMYTSTSSTSYSKTLGDLSSTITSAKKVSFIVLPYNDAGEADPADAKEVTWTVVKLK